MLDLEKCNVHLDKRYFDIVDSKTEAGIRKEPIAAMILTERVYTHFDVQQLIDAIDMI